MVAFLGASSLNEEGSGGGWCGLGAHFGADVEGEGGEEIGARNEVEFERVQFLGLSLEGGLFPNLQGEQVGGAQLEAVLFHFLEGPGKVHVERGTSHLFVGSDQGFVSIPNLGEDAVAGEEGLSVDLVGTALGFLDGAACLAALEGHAELETELEFEFVAVGVGVVAEGLDDFGAGIQAREHAVASKALVDLDASPGEFELADLGSAAEGGLELLGIRFGVRGRGGGELVREPGPVGDDRAVAWIAIEKGESEAGGFEAAAGTDDAEFAADDQLLVFLANDGGGQASVDLPGDGILAVLSDAEDVFSDLEAAAGYEPVVVGDRAGAEEVELLAADGGIGEFLVEAGAEDGGAAHVDGTVLEQGQSETGAEFAGALGSLAVVVGELIAFREAIAAEDGGAPDAEKLFDAGFEGGGFVVAAGSSEDARESSEVEGSAGATEASFRDVTFDECGEVRGVLGSDGIEDGTDIERSFESRDGIRGERNGD